MIVPALSLAVTLYILHWLLMRVLGAVVLFAVLAVAASG
jgi:hypothetical protein